MNADDYNKIKNSLIDIVDTIEYNIDNNYIVNEKWPTCAYIDIYHNYFNEETSSYEYEELIVLDDIFRGFSGNAYIWQWDKINGNWNPRKLTDSIISCAPIDSMLYKLHDKLIRTNKLNRILDGCE